MSSIETACGLQPFFIRGLEAKDRPALESLIVEDGLFLAEEIAVALELIDEACQKPDGDYRVLVAHSQEKLLGYICYGPTPMTAATWDLYWVVTHPASRGQGVARRLVESMENELRQMGARHIRVETSRTEGYGAAHLFYEKMKYPVVATFPDFYKIGDDLLVMYKRL